MHTKARIRTILSPFSTVHNLKQYRFNHFPIYGRVFKTVSSIYVFKLELFCMSHPPKLTTILNPFMFLHLNTPTILDKKLLLLLLLLNYFLHPPPPPVSCLALFLSKPSTQALSLLRIQV